MIRHAQLASLWLSLLLLTGCWHLGMSSRPFPHPPLPEALAAEVAEPNPGGFRARELSLETNRSFTLRRLELTMPSRPAGSNQVIGLDCYLPKRTNAPLPVVMVLAISGGDYELERHAARYFARKGFAAILVRRPESDALFTNGTQINGLLKRSVQNDQRVVDWIETRPEFDAQRIGVFAVSLGAIQGMMFVTSDRRVRAAALGMLGGDVADILAHTREKSYVKRRADMMRAENLTLAEWQRRFADAITCDPVRFAPYTEREKVMLVFAVFDQVVPFRNGWELRQAMGKPETLLVTAGHFTAVLYLPYIEGRALEFYRRRFKRGWRNHSPIRS